MISKDDDQVRLTLRVPEKLHASVKSAAQKSGMSVNSYIIKSLSESIARVDIPLNVMENENGDYVYVLPFSPWVYIEGEEYEDSGTHGIDG